MANRETSWLEGRKEVERSELFYPRDHPYPDGGGGGSGSWNNGWFIDFQFR